MENATIPPTNRLQSILLIGIAIIAAIALTLGIVSLGRAQTVAIPITSQQTGITVCGHGKSTIKPDQATLSIGVFAAAATAGDARSHAAQAMSAVLNALKSNGIADKDIQTQYFSIQPQYNYNNGNTPILIGYMVTNSVSAISHSIDTVGTVLDAATAAGGNNISINGVQFSTSDPSSSQADARGKALEDAKNQAQKIASATGVTLGIPISIQSSCGNPVISPVTYNSASNADQGTTTPIQPGQLDVTADVNVVYAIIR